MSDLQVAPPTAAPIWAQRLRGFTDHASKDFLGGPRLLKFSWVINFQKAGSFLFFGLLIWRYGNASAAAWVYLAMHGGYGLAWLIKDLAFPDPSWQVRITFGGALTAFATVLGPYWAFGWLLISRTAPPAYPLPQPAWFALCISLCLLGTVVMVAADAQKFYTLRARPGLITDGMYRWVRHPNYLGELAVYASLALMVWHWFPPLVLACVWSGVFSVNLVMKEASLARHPGWADYRRKTWWLIPFLF